MKEFYKEINWAVTMVAVFFVNMIFYAKTSRIGNLLVAFFAFLLFLFNIINAVNEAKKLSEDTQSEKLQGKSE